MNAIAAGVAIGLVTIFEGCTTPVTTKPEKGPELQCRENLIHIDSAKEQLAIEKRMINGETVSMEALLKSSSGYLDAPLACPSGGTYDVHPIGTNPTCSIPGHVLTYSESE